MRALSLLLVIIAYAAAQNVVEPVGSSSSQPVVAAAGGQLSPGEEEALLMDKVKTGAPGKGRPWSYTDAAKGPEKWADIDPMYAECRGKSQSPIDISPSAVVPSQGQMQPILFNYRPTDRNSPHALDPDDMRNYMTVYNDGQYVSFKLEPGSIMRSDANGEPFELTYLNFHAPSEHTIAGKRFDLEMQMVHKSKAGNVNIIVQLYERGRDNEFLNSIHWDDIPVNPGQAVPLNARINAGMAFPFDRNYFFYSGSLTTPPCDEGVGWYIIAEPQSVSTKQLERYRSAFGPTNRPIQSLNDRSIFSSAGYLRMAAPAPVSAPAAAAPAAAPVAAPAPIIQTVPVPMPVAVILRGAEGSHDAKVIAMPKPTDLNPPPSNPNQPGHLPVTAHDIAAEVVKQSQAVLQAERDRLYKKKFVPIIDGETTQALIESASTVRKLKQKVSQ